MKRPIIFLTIAIFFTLSVVKAQQPISPSDNANPPQMPANPSIVLVTGVRFSYPLVQRWIDEFNKVYPDVQVIIESRGITDPQKFDILVEAYTPSDSKSDLEYAYVARYAVLPVANTRSAIMRRYKESGLTNEIIRQIYFYDVFAEKKKDLQIPYTVYTRLQKAGSPITFAHHFGYEQQDISGKVIAGSDEHLLKAIIRDTSAMSYLPLPLIYNFSENKNIEGIEPLTMDFNGNGRVSSEEKLPDSPDQLIYQVENSARDNWKNLPMEYLNLSIARNKVNPAAIDFVLWVIQNGEKYLHDHGFLYTEKSQTLNEDFLTFAQKRKN